MNVMTEELKFADEYPNDAGKLAQRLHKKKDEIPLIRKTYFGETKKSEDLPQGKTVTAVITTADKDRDGEVLDPAGMIKDAYEENKIVLWGHSYKEPNHVIGKNLWLNPTKDGKGIVAKTLFRKNQFADEVYQLYTEDLEGTGPVLKGWSVGFIPIEWEDGDTKDKDVPKRTYKKWELLEYSAVTIPSNRNALTLAYQKGMITTKRLQKDLELELEVEDFQEEVEIENKTKGMTPDELKEHYRGERMVEIVGDDKEVVKNLIPSLEEEKDIYVKERLILDGNGVAVKSGTIEIVPDEKPDEEIVKDLKDMGIDAEVKDEEESNLQDTVNELIEEGIEDVEDLAFDDAENLAPDDVEEKRFDLEGNPSVWDIMDAISSTIRTPTNSKTWRYVTDLYPVKYPDGHVIIEESSEKTERKYFLHPYEYDEGKIKLGESKELEATYKPKERVARVEITDISGVVEQVDAMRKQVEDTIAELKEGRVLSRKNREVVKAAVNALADVLKADSTGSREDEDKEEVEDEKEVEVEIEKGEYSKEELQVVIDKALEKAIANMDLPKAIDNSVKKLKGVVE